MCYHTGDGSSSTCFATEPFEPKVVEEVTRDSRTAEDFIQQRNIQTQAFWTKLKVLEPGGI